MQTEQLLNLVRNHLPMTIRQEYELILKLALPSMAAQISTIAMFYIDAAMVGSLGADASASIGLVTSSLWVTGAIGAATAMGFSVQVAHRIGANDELGARRVLRQGYVCSLLVAFLISFVCVTIAPHLPYWLGGAPEICSDATAYFTVFAFSIPLMQLNFFSGAMLRCAGNMKIPSLINILMCLLDVVFNFFCIFKPRTMHLGSFSFEVWGAGLWVQGAALGTALAFLCCSVIMTYCACFKMPKLDLRHERGSFIPRADVVKRALQIGVPVGAQNLAISSAQIVSTMIVAPLGIVAIAAHSFAITIESLCYMPGNGVSEAATTLVGQAVGARRPRLTFAFAKLSMALGMGIMTIMGILMFIFAPVLMQIMTPDERVQNLAVDILRIEAFAEPMFAAAIVGYGIFVGAGDTLKPSLMNLGSMWGIRLTAAALMAPHYGLYGVWIAMCGELIFRGLMFIVRVWRGKWLKKVIVKDAAAGSR